jgi:hypothetical protein
MTDAMTKTSTVIITAPRALASTQRDYIIHAMQKNLPEDVGVVVLDGGITAQVVGDALVTVDAIPGELLQDHTNVLILEELRGLRIQLQRQKELFVTVGGVTVEP